ncbi:MAG: MFS transporter [Solibacillus sp.]|uniref:MFS transporter n=1 Tax=unclassified Solibacillus TaxID=2637870 RepID=UPI0031013325
MESTLKNRSTWIMVVLYFGWIVSYVDRTAITLALTSIGSDLTLTATQLGFVLSAFFMGYALMQIPGGWLADRFGIIKILIIAVAFWSVFTAFTGLAWSLVVLILIRFLFGIGEGGYPAASTKAIATYYEKSQRTKAQSTMMSSNMVGAALAPIICAPLLIVFGWRTVFFIISALGIIFIIGLLYFTRNAKTYIEEQQDKPKGSFKAVLTNPYLVKVLMIFFFVNLASWGLSSWMPTYLMQEHNINMASIGIVAAIPALFAAVGMIISGRIITTLGAKSKYGVILGTSVLAIALILMANTTSIVLIIVYQCVAFSFMSFVSAFIFTTPHRVVEESNVATAFGIVNFGGQAAGILAPTIMGYLITASGGSFNTSFIFLAIVCGIAACIAMLLPVKKTEVEEIQLKVVEG